MARNKPSPSSQPEPNWQNQPGFQQQGGFQPHPGYPQPPQGYGPPPGYGPGPAPKKRGGLATAALVLGIIGFILAVIPFVNFAAYPVVILAIVFGLFALGWGKAKAGLILGVLGLVATILWTVGIAGAFDDAVNKEHSVLYEVSGSGSLSKADISYYSSDGSNRSSNISADNQALPFRKTVTVKGDLSGFVLTANTPIGLGKSPAGTLTCRLSVDGKVVSTDTSSGSAQAVSCTGSGYDGK